MKKQGLIFFLNVSLCVFSRKTKKVTLSMSVLFVADFLLLKQEYKERDFVGLFMSSTNNFPGCVYVLPGQTILHVI